MKTLLTALKIASALSGQPDIDTLATQQIAQDSSKIEIIQDAPKLKLNLETGASNIFAQPIQYQRITLGNDNFELKYDFNKQGKDIGRLKVNLPSHTGLALYKQGEWDGQDKFFLEGWKSIPGETNFLIDAGLGYGKTTEPQYFAIGKATNKNIFLELGIFETGKNLTDFHNSIYAGAGYDFGNAYLGGGRHHDQLVGVTGIKGFEDFGNLTYGLYNTKTDNWSFKSQTAINNANQGFFSKDLLDFVVEYFAVPSFFPTHFTPQMTKGDLTLKFQGAGNPTQTELEAMIGVDNEILPFGIGVNTLSTNGERKTGVAIEAFKGFDLLGIKGSVEGRYNARTGDITGYLMMNYEL